MFPSAKLFVFAGWQKTAILKMLQLFFTIAVGHLINLILLEWLLKGFFLLEVETKETNNTRSFLFKQGKVVWLNWMKWRLKISNIFLFGVWFCFLFYYYLKNFLVNIFGFKKTSRGTYYWSYYLDNEKIMNY